MRHKNYVPIVAQFASTSKQNERTNGYTVPPSTRGHRYIIAFLGIFFIYLFASFYYKMSRVQSHPIPSPQPRNVGMKENGQTSSIMTGKASNRPKYYEVSEGESLWDIAVKFYGDGNEWLQIAKINNLDNPDNLPKGTKLKLP